MKGSRQGGACFRVRVLCMVIIVIIGTLLMCAMHAFDWWQIVF